MYKTRVLVRLLFITLVTASCGRMSRPSPDDFVKVINSQDSEKLLDLIVSGEILSEDLADDLIEQVHAEMGKIEWKNFPKKYTKSRVFTIGTYISFGDSKGYPIKGSNDNWGELYLTYCDLHASKPCGLTIMFEEVNR